MPEAVATLKIVGKDQASAELRKVQQSVAGLNGEIKRSQGSLGSLKELLSGIGGKFGVSGGAVGAGAAGAAIAFIGVEAYKAADALQVMENQAQGVFGEAFPRMQASAEELSGELRRSSSDMLQMETGFGAIFKGAGIAGGQMESLSEQLTRTSVAFGNFTGLADTEAFDLVQGGVLGMGRALQRYGVFVNDTTLEEYAHAKGIKAKTDEMSDAQKMFLRANMIQDQTNKLMGQGNSETRTARSEWKALKGQINDAFETIGKPVLSLATVAMVQLNDSINTGIGYWKSLSGAIGGATSQLGSFATLAARAVGFENVGITNLSKDKRDVSGVNAENVKQIGKAMTAVKNAKDKEVVDYFKSLGGAMSDAGGEAEKVRESMEDLGRAFEEEGRSIANRISEVERTHRQKMQDMGDQMEDLKTRLSDLAKDFAREMSSIDISEADVILRAEEKVTDLEKKLADLNRERDSLAQREGVSVGPKLQADIDEVTAELQKERRGLESIRGKAGGSVLATASERGALTDSEKSFADLESRRKQTQETNAREIQDTNEQITTLEKKTRTEVESYTQTRQQLESTRITMNSFRDEYAKAMLTIGSVTQSTVKGMKQNLDDLKSTISQIDALVASRTDVTGGGTTAGKVAARRDSRLSGSDSFLGDYPQVFIPASAGVTKGQQSSNGNTVSITISSMVVREEADIERIGEALARQMTLQSNRAA